MDSLGQAAPVHDDLGGSSLLQRDYFTTMCAKTHISTSSNDLPASYTPGCCVPRSLEALSGSRVLVSSLQSCQDMMPTRAGLSLSEAVWSHKLRIIHTLSNRARCYMGGWLEYNMLPFPFSGMSVLHAISFM